MSAESRSSLAGKRIVIIEDEGVSVLAFRRICQQAGMKVVGVASNGKEGVEVVLKERPDIVLTDINMPGMNGIEAARTILSKMKVCLVFVTAHADDYIQKTIADLGCHGYILKPVANDAMLSALESACGCFKPRDTN